MGDQRNGRRRLSPEIILDAAMALADREGIDALTIRALADELNTRPMTLYHHIDGKDAVIGGMVERVFAEMAAPPQDLPWRDAIRARCLSARDALVRHPWSVPLLESRVLPGPESLAHHEAVLAALTRGGLPLPLVAHAYAILDSFIYGFAIQESNLPVQGGDGSADLAEQISEAFDPDLYPNLLRLTVQHVMRPGYSFADSFEFGLDLLLGGIEAAGRP